MNWEKVLELSGGSGNSISLTVAEVVSTLIAGLSTDDLDELAGELITSALVKPELGL